MGDQPPAASLPPIEAVDSMPPQRLPAFLTELSALAMRASARLTAFHSHAGNDTADEVLAVKEAAKRLGVEVGYLRREGDRLHAEFLAATGTGFILPWGEGTVRYSSAGIEALKRWRREQPRRRTPK